MSVPPKNSFVPQAASRWRFKPQVLASLCALLALPLWGASPYRLLVIGDSISVGYTDNPTWSVPYQFGFRSGLYTRLTNSGMAVQFVGGGAGALGWEIWHPGQPAATGPLLDRPAQARIRDNVLKALPLILLWIWASATPASWTFGGEIIELTSPLVREVFQHDAQEQAAVRIAGRVPATTTQIEVRAELDPQATRGQVVEWTLVARDTQIAGGAFSVTLKLQTGGWYTLRVRARSGDRVLAETVVDMVGVGDVFITAGQSNSANAGEPRQSAQDNRVVYFDGRSFAQANDPIPGSFGEGGSPWSILGDMLVRTHAERWYASLCAQYNLANPVSSIPGLAP